MCVHAGVCSISYRCHRRLASWLVVKEDDLSLGQRSYLIPVSLYLSATTHTYKHTSTAAPSGVLSLQPIFGWIFWLQWCYWDPSILLQQKHSKRHLRSEPRTDALCRERTFWHVCFCLHDFQTGGFRVVSSWRGDPAGVVPDVSGPRLADVKGAFFHRHSTASRYAQHSVTSLPRVPEKNETDKSRSMENITLRRPAKIYTEHSLFSDLTVTLGSWVAAQFRTAVVPLMTRCSSGAVETKVRPDKKNAVYYKITLQFNQYKHHYSKFCLTV